MTKNKWFFLILLIFANSCGPSNSSTTGGTCGANVVDEGLQISMTKIGTNTYQLELCAPANPPSVYSVYGGIAQADLAPNTINLNGAIRAAHIRMANDTGSKFQVSFHNSDHFFAIYKDKDLGSDTYAEDSTSAPALVKPHAIPEN